MLVETGPRFDKVLKKNPAYRQIFDKLKARIVGPPGLTEQEMRSMDGIHLEPIKTNPPNQSIHVGNKLRAICQMAGNTIVFLDLPESHEKSYRGSLVVLTASLLR